MLNARKPALEKVLTGFGNSFSVKHYKDPSPHEKPPFWHFHPEIEMVYVKGGSGKRHIGNHLSYYQSGDLVLIGSMLPHTGFTDRLTGNESETIIQFNNDCFGAGFFGLEEMQDIQRLLQRAKAGIAFQGRAKQEIGARMEKLVTLDNFAKLIELLCILQDMAWTEEYVILNAGGYALEVENTDNDRINVIYDYVQANFQRSIPLDEIAAVTNMTVPSFCRYFKRISGKKFTRFVNEIRIVHACKLLTEQQESISNISFESGFNNFSHFNRLFKDITQKSPSEYRKQFFKVFHETVSNDE
ncbi:MAG: helix-turn-helix transcriptional regulator [Lewinellaceae bacterium]|nr:helix-turn-helix transcriptional regulator [Lewinellaceae bacterium]